MQSDFAGPKKYTESTYLHELIDVYKTLQLNGSKMQMHQMLQNFYIKTWCSANL